MTRLRLFCLSMGIALVFGTSQEVKYTSLDKCEEGAWAVSQIALQSEGNDVIITADIGHGQSAVESARAPASREEKLRQVTSYRGEESTTPDASIPELRATEFSRGRCRHGPSRVPAESPLPMSHKKHIKSTKGEGSSESYPGVTYHESPRPNRPEVEPTRISARGDQTYAMMSHVDHLRE